MKNKLLRGVLAAVALLLAVLLAYIAYLFLSYHRIEDQQPLTPTTVSASEAVQTGTDYSIISYNVGFGAYLPEYTFFMDGGKSSRAISRDGVLYSTDGAAALVNNESPDFIVLEEVDLDSDRSWHVDQYARFSEAFGTGYSSTFAVNYDSAYLFYPFLAPIGASKSGIACYSRFPITSSLRRSLPITTDFSKFFDLDRCYSVNRIPVEGGKELVLYAVHLSAYTSDAAVRDGQTEMLYADMAAEYAKGNYVLCAGDMNRDMKSLEDDENTYSWAHALDRSQLPAGITLALDQLPQEEIDAFPDTTRYANIPYTPGVSTVFTIDGFLLSDNIAVKELTVPATDYAYSDHNPVKLVFTLNP